MNIILYATQAEAEAALEFLHAQSRILWQAEGYTVNADGHVVAKNAQTGEDNPSAVVTRWDDVHEHPNGGWYFASPRLRYPDYFDQLISGNYTEETLTLPAGDL